MPAGQLCQEGGGGLAFFILLLLIARLGIEPLQQSPHVLVELVPIPMNDVDNGIILGLSPL
jgi:hypothetical protein